MDVGEERSGILWVILLLLLEQGMVNNSCLLGAQPAYQPGGLTRQGLPRAL